MNYLFLHVNETQNGGLEYEAFIKADYRGV